MVGEETGSIKAKWVAKIEWFQWFIKHCPLNPHFSLKKKDVKETGRVFFCFSFKFGFGDEILFKIGWWIQT